MFNHRNNADESIAVFIYFSYQNMNNWMKKGNFTNNNKKLNEIWLIINSYIVLITFWILNWKVDVIKRMYYFVQTLSNNALEIVNINVHTCSLYLHFRNTHTCVNWHIYKKENTMKFSTEWPFSHMFPAHPTWQPPVQKPVFRWHFPGTLQFMLHFFEQLDPNSPCVHSDKKTIMVLLTFSIIPFCMR